MGKYPDIQGIRITPANPRGRILMTSLMCDDAVTSPAPERIRPMKHLVDCPWLAADDVNGCRCAEQTFLATCTDEERRTFEQRNTVHLTAALDVSRTTWTPQQRSA